MRHARRSAIALLISLSLFAAACDANKIREARKGAYRIQVVTDAAIDTTATLFHDGVIDKQQTNRIALALLKVNNANLVLINKAEALKVDSPEARTALLADFKLVEDAVKELKATGVLGIKSKNGELAFTSTINAIDTSLALIQAALAGR